MSILLENLQWKVNAHTQYPQAVYVLATIVATSILWPYFIEGSLTGETFLELLQRHTIPATSVMYPNDENHDLPDLDLTFPPNWIGRCGST